RRSPTGDPALAYWINAYNAFVLAAVIEEYPIRSVWKVRNGQFFERARHVAGGRLVSLNEIEHHILRERYREPRIHFAINCASNGCPPMRPRGYEPVPGRRSTPPPVSFSPASGTAASTTRSAASTSRASSGCTRRTSRARWTRRKAIARGWSGSWARAPGA